MGETKERYRIDRCLFKAASMPDITEKKHFTMTFPADINHLTVAARPWRFWDSVKSWAVNISPSS